MKELTNDTKAQIIKNNIGSDVFIKDPSPIYQLSPDLKHGVLRGYKDIQVCIIDIGPHNTIQQYVIDIILIKKSLTKILDGELHKLRTILYPNIDSEWVINREYITTIWIDNPTNEDYSFCVDSRGYIECFNADPLNVLHAYQYLQLQGYAFPYLNWSVDELVKNEVYKLI